MSDSEEARALQPIVRGFFKGVGVSSSVPQEFSSKGSDPIRNLLTVQNIERGHISCVFSALPVIGNFYGGVHGGALAAIAEKLSIACARTVVAEDKEITLGELGISYLSAAAVNEVIVVDASAVRSGRNISVVTAEFKIKKTGKLVYLTRATFYHMPISKL